MRRELRKVEVEEHWKVKTTAKMGGLCERDLRNTGEEEKWKVKNHC